MRRRWGVVVGTAVVVLMARVTTDAALSTGGPPRYDFASALMLSVFGETSDAKASFFAQNGDRISESPLRELALRVTSPERNLTAQIAYVAPPAMPQTRLTLSSLGNDPAVLSRAAAAGLVPSGGYALAAPAVGAQQVLPPLTLSDTPTYRPLPPAPSISPAPGTLAFEAPALDGGESSGFTLQTDAPLTLSGTPPTLAAPAFSAPADPLPSLASTDRAALAGSLSMPQLRRVTINVDDDTQHPYGNDAMLGVPNLGPAPNLYAGKLTYAIPSLSSTLSVSAYQERLGQNVMPPTAYTNNGGDVNFTVKF